ncbi:protein MOTHER of FT and TFL1 [Andrographis paniculata]|uniref:protein MOTHER of FT and TFL1 n=1 Tax=Andrographis paniculata TaxID=175694 RepID=UPI0021E94E21|nr:protein MOTHER of FT and TFL1 [Andrographis paniculata]
MAARVDPMIVRRVIGDVVDVSVPSVAMSVYYAAKHVNNGCDVKPSAAVDAPRVYIAGLPDQFYTLVMTDPDAPSPSEPSLREWVNWIVTDIPGCSNASIGKEVLPYLGPSPAVGIHRYILVLFRQKSALLDKPPEPPALRSNFNTRAFAEKLELGTPVATVYFNARREPANRKR